MKRLALAADLPQDRALTELHEIEGSRRCSAEVQTHGPKGTLCSMLQTQQRSESRTAAEVYQRNWRQRGLSCPARPLVQMLVKIVIFECTTGTLYVQEGRNEAVSRGRDNLKRAST